MKAITKTVLRAEKTIRVVVSTLREHRDVFAGGLDESFRAFLDAGGAMPDFAGMADLMVARLEATGRALFAADLARTNEKAIDSTLRSRRDKVALELYGEIVALKGTVRHVYGPLGVEVLGFARRLEEDAVTVLWQAERLLGRLADPELRLPPPRASSLAIDPAAVARSLTPKLEALRGLVDRLDAETSRTDTAQLTKNAAVETYKRDVVQITRAAVALFRLIGRDDIADRLAPLAGRSLRRGRQAALPGVITS